MTRDEVISSVIDNTIKHEGGWSDHKADKGGKTNWGITLGTYKRYNPKATEQTLRALTIEQAREFYKKNFFDGNNVAEYPQEVWDVVFDMCVNHGPKNAVLIAQKALSTLGYKIGLDGVYGKQTKEAMAKVDPKAFRQAIISQRTGFFGAIISKNPSQKVFAAGWMNRVATFANKNPIPEN